MKIDIGNGMELETHENGTAVVRNPTTGVAVST